VSIKDDFENGDGDYGAITADFESMGYQLAGTLEFYDNPETGLCAFRSMSFVNDREKSLELGEENTEGQKALLTAQALFEEYINSEHH
jgi:hypothetical protein